MTVLVTGVTGRVGGRLARTLVGEGRPVRGLVRDPSRGDALPREIELAVGDYADADSLDRAFAGVERAFMVCLPEAAPGRLVKHDNVVAAAARAGVRHLAYLSFLGASPDSAFPQGRWHAHTEASLTSAGVPSTHLRAGLYQSSLLSTAGVRIGDQLLAPAGDGRTAPVAWQDIADAAAAVLTAEGHQGRTYDLTGPELLGWADLARVLSAVTGANVVYEPISPEHYRSMLAETGAASELIEGLLGLFADIRTHRMATLSDTIPSLTGSPATDVAATFTLLTAEESAPA